MESKWNTGRQYSAEGQLMRAKIIDYDRIAFVDMTRGLDGIIYGQFSRLKEEANPGALHDVVMLAYDQGLHVYPKTADERDAMEALKA